MVSLNGIRNSIGSRLVTADRSFDAQLEKAGIFNLRQEDFMVRHRHLQWLNDMIENPFMEINDKIRLVNRAMGEVAATFIAMGGDKVFQYRAMCWKKALITWDYSFNSLRDAHSYYTVVLNVQEPRLVLSQPEGDKPPVWITEYDERRVEVDADTYLHYYKTNGQNVEIVDVIPHGGIEGGGRVLPTWRGSQDRRNLQTVGMELVHHGEFCVWASFMPEHVNPRTSIIIHSTTPKQEYGGIVSPTGSMGDSLPGPGQAAMPRVSKS